jgi:hypothetical protein
MTPASCASTVLETLGRIAKRIYREGIASERTIVAHRLIENSPALRAAVASGDRAAARAAAQALLATGHITNLRVVRDGRLLVAVGPAVALAPLTGTISSGGASASYTTSVWSAEGLVAETDGVAEGSVVLRTGPRTLAGALRLPAVLSPSGRFKAHGVTFQYVSFPITVYPSGVGREYLVRSVSSTAALCGRTEQDTVVNTLTRIARLFYAAEGGPRTRTQVRRVQHDPALLDAVARRDPQATRAAIEALLNQHIVRLRVSAGGRLLSDVGGPDVLAPVGAPLVRAGRQIGSFVLSIQDDEGYLRLTRRLLGLRVLMQSPRGLVKNDLGPNPGAVPASGTYSYRGSRYRAYQFTAQAFPTGKLRIWVLVPIPYA